MRPICDTQVNSRPAGPSGGSISEKERDRQRQRDRERETFSVNYTIKLSGESWRKYLQKPLLSKGLFI